MTRIGHRLLGGAVGLGVSAVATLPAGAAVVVTVAAVVASTWPDVDQRRWWRPLRRFRALQHRRLTHWWGLPVAFLPVLPVLEGPLVWLVGGALAGWLSHLAGDWVFGKRGPAVTGWRGAGVPLAPWWGYHGLGLRCGGAVEKFVAWPVLAGLAIGGVTLWA